jgi:L-cystine uptake protein TcyP (sodium:dicarboxylate symporter family)
MKIKDFLIRFLIAFVVAFVINALVVYLWNLIRYGEGAFNWSLAFYFGIVCGIVFGILLGRRKATDPS